MAHLSREWMPIQAYELGDMVYICIRISSANTNRWNVQPNMFSTLLYELSVIYNLHHK
jgi:hypothetical protein